MSFSFSEDLRTLIDQQLATGRYTSEEDVLREALFALRERDEDLVALREGIADMEAGRVRPLKDVFDDLERRLGEQGV